MAKTGHNKTYSVLTTAFYATEIDEVVVVGVLVVCESLEDCYAYLYLHSKKKPNARLFSFYITKKNIFKSTAISPESVFADKSIYFNIEKKSNIINYQKTYDKGKAFLKWKNPLVSMFMKHNISVLHGSSYLQVE